MFEFLRNYRLILVTGPQRSGTRICAHMIAKDTGFLYVDEVDFGTHSAEKFSNVIKNKGIVVQCPAMCHSIHKYSADDVAVIIMLRDIADIIASQERIGWKGETRELKKYRRNHGVISEVKYTNWLLNQRRKIHHPYEIEYKRLASHPLWVDPDKRKDFEDAQWKP